jgi:RNA polymerase sigma factor (sigma-70 family)
MTQQASASSGVGVVADVGEDEVHRWEDLMRRFERPLRGYFASRIRNPSDIDDLVQEVFVQLLRRSSGGPIEHVQQYLFQVASSVLCDQGRYMKSRRLDAHETYEEDLHAVPTEISLERIVIGEETLRRMNAALLELPERTRDIFFLRAIQQRKHEEVAALLGISTRIVHKHMARALTHLHAFMNELS